MVTLPEIPVALFNFENGGQISPGNYDFSGLREAFTGLRDAPVLIGVNEAKQWGLWGEMGALEAASVLSKTLRRPYEVHLTASGELGAATFYDPTVFEPKYRGRQHDPTHSIHDTVYNKTVYADKENLQCFRIRDTDIEIFTYIDQWSHDDRYGRYGRATKMDYLGRMKTPTIVWGDFNSTASGGEHLPQRDWERVPLDQRCHKGIQYPDGSWGPATAAVDHLIGEWDEATHRRGHHARFRALCEIAHFDQGLPRELAFAPTVNDHIDRGGALLIDWILINDSWCERGGLVPDTYHVHIPAGSIRADYPSDHRLITATLEIAA